jgi:hypothetical protein
LIAVTVIASRRSLAEFGFAWLRLGKAVKKLVISLPWTEFWELDTKAMHMLCARGQDQHTSMLQSYAGDVTASCEEPTAHQ